ncbi:unnamed protein product [Clonostachys rosea f. rosea IK726]|uniref:U4/U6 snRNA-associated-splicing factor PRP24 n=2 Tax=Bionectria ochroleuca TaxID=29856 RepID=A0A0B7KE30_BIOOC|nr:unnamed protein product [Clonostachys rosea f. rosea IK726]
MANPIGEDSWLAYLEEIDRNASDLEKRVNAVEIYKRAVNSEPGSLRLWLAYCNYFWSLWEASQSPTSGWPEEEQVMGQELFSFGAALDLWQQGYEAVKYRLDDSHQLWNRWVSLELELLAKTKTPEGVKRISHLYRNRLQTPHLNWDETSQAYSSFLSEYNKASWEESMKDVTQNAQEAKRLIAARDPFELKLQKAQRSDDLESQKTVMSDYIEWEMRQSRRNNDHPEIGIDLCRGLYSRALTGVFSSDESMWYEYATFLSSSFSDPRAAEMLLEPIRCAVQHCPWSGRLWNRFILTAEDARLPFAEIESIKHSATSEEQLYKDGMESMIEMYVAWCGFLKRTAMDAEAGDEAVDVADVGLPAALEDVAVTGKRRYGKNFQGDPKFRLERMYIQYLTEKKGAVDEARAQWNKMASLPIHADNHDFWFRFYMWEMLIFSSKPQTMRSPTPSSLSAGFKVPSQATSVLSRAVARRNIDWPEKVLEVYIQHCNDYEPPNSVRVATDRVYKAAKEVRKRREQEEREKQEAYSAYYAAQNVNTAAPTEVDIPSDGKRKRGEDQPDTDHESESASKRQKNESIPETQDRKPKTIVKRDRENTTVIVENLPEDVTQPQIRQYFKEYGHINGVTALVKDGTRRAATALIEFKSAEEAQSALLRNDKYFGQSQLGVRAGHDLTIYVTNYPPAADEDYIRQIFEGCGEILSIRYPSLGVNTHRRFCYVSFRDQKSSARAVEKDGTLIENKYRLVAKYSDPGNKKKREGAVAEGREIHISGLERSAKEEHISEVVSKYGSVKRVNVPLTLAGKNRGFAYVEFSTKEEAEKAVVELHNIKFRNHILAVEISKEMKVKKSTKSFGTPGESAPSPVSATHSEHGATEGNSSREAISARSIALMGLPDTVNDARVQALLAPLGTVVKLVLQPSQGSASVEFADAAMAGKAALKLNGMAFEGNELRTGSLEDLLHGKSGSRDTSAAQSSRTEKPGGRAASQFVPSSMVRRPGAQRPGPKKGLGFTGAKKTPTVDSASGVTSDIEKLKSTGVSKGNADFKAMFLASSTAAAQPDGDKEAK